MTNTRTRPPGLPDFKNPPVTEVVLSVQFATLARFRNVHAGLYWIKIREEYPEVSEQAPIPPAFETFGATPGLGLHLEIQASAVPLPPRYWFETADGEHLIQLQQDRILHNWRQRSLEMKYPHYESLQPKFEKEVDKFAALLQEENIGELRPNQCEITYINTIVWVAGESPHDHLARITPLWAGNSSDPLFPTPETTAIQTQFVLRRDDDLPFGRAYVNFAPAYRAADHTRVIQLMVTARGRPDEESVASAFALLDDLRNTAVRIFAGVTTSAMHKEWGRIYVPE